MMLYKIFPGLYDVHQGHTEKRREVGQGAYIMGIGGVVTPRKYVGWVTSILTRLKVLYLVYANFCTNYLIWDILSMKIRIN